MIYNIPEKVVIEDKKTLRNYLMMCGIKSCFFSTAKKGNVDLNYLFYLKLLKYCNGYTELSLEEQKEKDIFIEKGRKEMASKLYGALGNYYAYEFFKNSAFDVSLEVDINVGNENKARPDLAIYATNGSTGEKSVTYCEVKTISQIVDSLDNYIDLNDTKLSYRKDPDFVMYEAIGKKLLDQIKKLKHFCKIPMVIVYRDCIVDKNLMKKIKSLGAVVYRIENMGFSDIEREVNEYLDNIIGLFKEQIILDEECLERSFNKKHK